MWDHVRSCETMWDHVRSCEIMWDLVRSCEIMWDLVRSCEIMWDLVRSCEIMWDHMRSWVHVIPCDHTQWGQHMRKERELGRRREEGRCMLLTCATAWSSCFARASCSYRDAYVWRRQEAGKVGWREEDERVDKEGYSKGEGQGKEREIKRAW